MSTAGGVCATEEEVALAALRAGAQRPGVRFAGWGTLLLGGRCRRCPRARPAMAG